MRFGNSSGLSAHRRSREGRVIARPCVETLEQRQLLSISAPTVGTVTPSTTTTGTIVPVTIEFGSVSGTVKNTGGGAIAGAAVVVYGINPTASPGTTPTPVPILYTTTDQNGAFSLPKVPVGTYVAAAFKAGYFPNHSEPFSVTQGNNSVVSLILGPQVSGSASGTVDDTSGNAVANALVVLTPAPSPLATGAPNIPTPLPPFFAITDLKGNFSFPQVPPGMYTATAFKVGYEKTTTGSFTITAGQNTVIPTIVLKTLVLATVDGQVTDATTGKPIAGARVELSPAPTPLAIGTTTTPNLPSPVPQRYFFTTTDQNGNYSFQMVPEGSYIVSALAQGYEPAHSAPFAVSGPTTTAPKLALTPLPTPVFGSVSGLVTDSTGKAIADALVIIVPAPSATAAASTSFVLPTPGSIQFTHTDSNGDYSFAKVPTGKYIVIGLAPGFKVGTTAPFAVNQGTNTAPTLALAALPPIVTPV